MEGAFDSEGEDDFWASALPPDLVDEVAEAPNVDDEDIGLGALIGDPLAAFAHYAESPPVPDTPEAAVAMWAEIELEKDRQKREDLDDQWVQSDEDERRANTLASREEEIAHELAQLPENYTMGDVAELRARKDKERALEDDYGINVTAQSERRNDGTRVVWTETELDQVKAGLDQVPPDMLEDGRLNFTALVRQEFVHGDKNESVNGAYTGDGVIRMADLAANTNAPQKREMKTDEFVQAHGENSTFFERVFLHELGHSAESGDPASGERHDKHHSTLAGTDLKPHGEYYAEDFKNALIAPTQLYEDTFHGQAAKTRAAHEAYRTNPTPENLAVLTAAQDQEAAYAGMYYNTRNNVFHTNDRENAIAIELMAKGYSMDEIRTFRAEAQRVSTPQQLDELARRQGYL